jgi:hypothetical protein
MLLLERNPDTVLAENLLESSHARRRPNLRSEEPEKPLISDAVGLRVHVSI